MDVQTTTCDGACTVTLVVESAPITEEKAADLSDMFWSFMLAACLVWGVKKILSFFEADHG